MSTETHPANPTADSDKLTFHRARQILTDVARASKLPGVSIAVADPQGILFSAAFGFADLAHRRPASVHDQYPWFSMTKIATATAAVRLHSEGMLDLDVPIGTYLTRYRPSARHGHPTTRQLLTHTAGLANPLPIRWVRADGQPEDQALHDRIVARYGTPRRTVGAYGAYSNIGYLLAADVMEAVTGQPIQDCVRDAVLHPLRMDSTGFTYQAQAPRSTGYMRLSRPLEPLLRLVLPGGLVGARVAGHTSLRPFLLSGAGFGGLVGSVVDAAKLAAAHAAAPADPHPVLPHADIQRMRAITAAGKPFDHGIGWFRRPADAKRTPPFVEHYGTGVGFWNAMRIYPDQRLAMVAMANTTSKWDVDGLFTQLRALPWH